MKKCAVYTLGLVLGLVEFMGQAQFYAPETELHDKAQRLFVVESTRLLAWRENQRGANITEIAYRVSIGTNRVTTWSLQWLDRSSAVAKEFTVRYPETLLGEGPGFYRRVFQDLWSQAGGTANSNLSAQAVSENFWRGADRNGAAREIGLQAAFKLCGEFSAKTETETAPQLAGLLATLPMPSLCGGFTLDAALLARSAAWLALSETMLQDRARAADENWAPILFMAGRENAASALWQSKVKADSAAQSSQELYRWWDFFLRRPTARSAYEFVTDASQRRFALPMMTYYSRLEYLGTTLVEVLGMMYGRNSRQLSELYNYGGFLAASTDVGGGRLLEGYWPAIFRAHWAELLRNFPATPLDYLGYTNHLAALPGPGTLRPAAEKDLSLVGLKDFAPLLGLGYEQGVGKLIPVGVVTARDLLNYGWEMNGLQMGARYYFIEHIWGIPDLAETVFAQAMRDIDGQTPFFTTGLQGKVFNLASNLNRLQMVDDLGWRVNVNIHPFARDTSDPEGARTFYRRNWLRPYEVRWQAWALTKAGQCDERLWLLQQYHAACGPKSDVLTLEYFQDAFAPKDFDADPVLKQLKDQIAKSMIEPTSLQIKILYRQQYDQWGFIERGEAYEKIFWANPDSGVEQDAFNGYIAGGAWKSAKRFYQQVRETVSRDVSFSNIMAPQAWMLGFLSDDEELMALAVKDSDTGSKIAMITQIWHQAAQGDDQKVEEQLDEMIKRYESESGPRSMARVMKGFLPLLPALRDPKSLRHEEALDYFGRSETAVIYRWILIQKYKLSPAESIRFLGGKETDLLRRLLVLHLQKEEEKLRPAFNEYISSTANKGAGRALASWATGQPRKIPSHYQQNDLRVAGAKTIRQAVWEKLKAQ